MGLFLRRNRTQYTKPPLTLEQQADLLLSRGLIGDRERLIDLLSNLNYYRLSAYLYPFRRKDGTEKFTDGTNIDTILEIYRFDEGLRNSLVAGLEKIEISLRTKVAYHFSHACGPFGYLDIANLPDCNRGDLAKLLAHMQDEKEKSSEAFIEHFVNKYGDCHEYFPLWMAVELMSFGTLHNLWKGFSRNLREAIANDYGIHGVVLDSWFLSLNVLRNLCAHHSRIWNRIFGFKPMIPKKDPLWNTPFSIPNQRLFGFASVIVFLVQTDRW